MGVSNTLQLRRTRKRLDNIALLVGQLASVKVRFTTSGLASTDGKTISIRVGDFSDDHFVNMAIGLAFHEGGHVKHTDFDATNNLNGSWFRVYNAVEDVRMEGLVQRDFKGAKKYLHYVNKDLFAGKTVKQYTSPFSLVNDYIVYRGFTLFTGNVVIRPNMMKVRQQLFDMLGETNALEVESIIDEIPNAKDTYDSLKITQKLRDFLQQIEPEKPDSDDSDDSDEGGHGQNNEDTESAGDDSDGASDEQSDDDSSDSQTNTDDSNSDTPQETSANDDVDEPFEDGDDSSSADSSDKASSDSKPTINQFENNPFEDENIDDSECMQDVHEAVRQTINELSDQFATDNPDEYRENLEYSANSIGNIDHSPSGYDRQHELDSVTGQINQIKLIMKRALIDQARVRRNYVRDGGVLDGQRVLDLVTNPNTACIFRNEKRAKAPSAAVSIIVDASWSMEEAEDKNDVPPFRVANQAAYAMASALDMLPNVECEVRHMVDNKSLLTKRFACPIDLNRFAVKPSGCTPTAPLVKGSVASLCGHRFDKKLIIVITDGKPDCVDSLRLAVSDAQIAGIGVKGIGINCPTYGIDDGVIIEDINELHAELSHAVRNGIFD
ncbi:hypothetical protein [uncultured Alteromonas sp.]|uniref:hypothetical protein n=1 Tax=uncultured Alteromonas sp. TaxID=179113 RepID=UPI0030D2C7E5|tara:strand:- start:19691 stop:21517 length:1827 start_codon:yes stop_codon:yes gene_type:complete